MKDIRFTPLAFEQYIEWEKKDKDIFAKINRLIIETARNPFQGIGKPEPLKHEYKGYWSRRISDEHRLIYRVEEDHIKVIACRLHYWHGVNSLIGLFWSPHRGFGGAANDILFVANFYG